MNFLAHIFLSGNDNEIKIGNFIADDIKGSSFLKYPEKIALGVKIHRTIDSFADSHSIYSTGKKRLKEKYGHYSGVVLDVFFDHFLALYWNNFSNQNLKSFSRNFYMNLVTHSYILTPKYRYIMPFMIVNDWLGSYVEVDNIESVLARLSRRTSLPQESLFAKEILIRHYNEFQTDFFEFMPQMIKIIEDKYKIEFATNLFPPQ